MFAEVRRNGILKLLELHELVKVKELSERFKVSSVIIRKDLKLLENENKLIRTHGGAIKNKRNIKSTTIFDRKMIHNKEKNEIAKKAYNQIKENDFICLDTTSINYILAKFLTENPKKITVVTNMLEIVNLLAYVENIKVISVGGFFNEKLGGFYGKEAINILEKFNIDKLFLGCAGINIFKETLSNFDFEEGEIKNAMIKASEKIYLLTESNKFLKDGVYNFSNINIIDYVVSDNGVLPKFLDYLNNKNIIKL